jgi:Zn-dependent protease with chaperone function
VILEVLENFLFFATSFALAGVTAAWAARRATLRRPDVLRPRSLARLYTVALVLPPLAAVWLVAAALLPRWWLGDLHFRAAHPAPLHSIHLIGNLTGRLEPTLAYALLVLVAGTAVVVAWSTARGHRRLAWAIGRLQLTSAAPPAARLAIVEDAVRRHGLDVGLIQSDYPLSFVWGFRRSKLVLSSGLLAALTPAELVAVLEHEAAHHARRDNLVKLALTVCAHASLAAPFGRRLLRWRTEQVELLCDEIAAARTSAPLDIAEALVKLRRRTQALGTRPALGVPASRFIPDDDRSVERRVRRLVAFADAAPRPAPVAAPPRAATALAVASLFALSLVGLGTWAPLAAHAVAESVLQALN